MASNQLLSLPAAATGLTPASNATAWLYGSWVQATATTTTPIVITGFEFQTTNIPAVDVTDQKLFEIGIGGAGLETIVIQIPYSHRSDTAAHYYMPATIKVFLPEPYAIPTGVRVAVRATDSITGVVTYNGVKLFYRETTSPTTALNTPTDTATSVSVTPTLNFTGTDTEAADVEYQVQIHTDNTFTSVVGSYATSNIDSDFTVGTGASRLGVGQSFTGNGKKINSVSLSLKKVGTPAGSVFVSLYAHTGTFGSTGLPTGLALATTTSILASSLTTSYVVTEFFFLTNYVLVNGANYVITVTKEIPDIANYFVVGGDSSSPTHSGNSCNYDDSSGGWVAETGDLSFSVSCTSLIDAESGVDLGFTAGNPYASGVAKEFTVQAANTLANSTVYHWRVRTRDPLDSTFYGAWATTRSFTTTSGGPPPAYNRHLQATHMQIVGGLM